MNFALGFYRTRDGSIVELLCFFGNNGSYKGRAIISSATNLNRILYWNREGNATHYNTELDLVEYLPHYPEEPARRP